MSKRLIIGLGTGRCGTLSVSQLLDRQDNVRFFHEMRWCKWTKDYEAIEHNIDILNMEPLHISGDVGYYYLNYVDYISTIHDDVVFFCLKRDKEDTVNSWFNHMVGRNIWTYRDSEHWGDHLPDLLEQAFPKYDLPKREAIAQYYDDYYRKAEEYALRKDNFRIFDMETILNTDEGQREFMSYLRIENPLIFLKNQFNKEGDRLVIYTEMPHKSGMCDLCKGEEARWYADSINANSFNYICDKCRLNRVLHSNKEVVCQK